MKFALFYSLLSLGVVVDGETQKSVFAGEVMPPQVVDEFKRVNILKEDFDPILQEISSASEEVYVGGEIIPLDVGSLSKVDMYTHNAKYLFDGVEQADLPHSSIYSSDYDPNVLVVRTPEKVQCVSMLDPVTSEMVHVVPIEPGSDIFVKLSMSDVDATELSKYKFEDATFADGKTPGSRRLRRPGYTQEESIEGDTRFLQGCPGFRVIELAVAYDSTFCADVGGTEQLANSAVERIVADVSLIYQQVGLCLKVEIAAIDGFCNPAVDPYASIINFSVSGITSEFMRFITNDPVRSSIPRDTFHLFYGGKPGFGSIGFAYLDVLCDQTFGFGVNEVTYSFNPALQANLVAHEVGYV